MNTANWLKELRDEAGYTSAVKLMRELVDQHGKEAVAAAGITEGNLKNWEKPSNPRKNGLDAKAYELLAKTFGREVETLRSLDRELIDRNRLIDHQPNGVESLAIYDALVACASTPLAAHIASRCGSPVQAGPVQPEGARRPHQPAQQSRVLCPAGDHATAGCLRGADSNAMGTVHLAGRRHAPRWGDGPDQARVAERGKTGNRLCLE